MHRPGERFTDFIAVRDEIIFDTDKVVGNNKGISAEPINLKIYSPNGKYTTPSDPVKALRFFLPEGKDKLNVS